MSLFYDQALWLVSKEIILIYGNPNTQFTILGFAAVAE